MKRVTWLTLWRTDWLIDSSDWLIGKKHIKITHRKWREFYDSVLWHSQVLTEWITWMCRFWICESIKSGEEWLIWQTDWRKTFSTPTQCSSNAHKESMGSNERSLWMKFHSKQILARFWATHSVWAEFSF